MKILLLNLGLYGSTGSIVLDLKEQIEKTGNMARLAYPEVWCNRKGFRDDIIIKGEFSRKANHFLEKITGYQGCFSWFKTIRFIDDIKKYNPDLIHIHVIHKVNFNLPMLFRFFKQFEKPIVWTFHDCWAFTGQCPYFLLAKCDKWMRGCYKCPQYKKYPEVWVDQTKKMWKLKKRWFTGIRNLIIVTPSNWLAGLVKESFLKEYPVKVINNGIDLHTFKPTPSAFRRDHCLEDKYIILGVAAQWETRKGIDVFVELSKRLDDSYVIILVGTTDKLDDILPSRVVSIHATTNKEELVKIYSAADVFVNPTREDNFPTVNLEALACGTPVVTFDSGGSAESIDDSCGRVVPVDDMDRLIESIQTLVDKKECKMVDCVTKAQLYDKQIKYMAYINLYEDLLMNDKRNGEKLFR